MRIGSIVPLDVGEEFGSLALQGSNEFGANEVSITLARQEGSRKDLTPELRRAAHFSALPGCTYQAARALLCPADWPARVQRLPTASCGCDDKPAPKLHRRRVTPAPRAIGALPWNERPK